MTKATEMIFFRRISGSALAAALLTIPAEREWSHAPQMRMAREYYSGRGHRAVTEMAMAVRRTIGDMCTRPLAFTRAT